MAFRQNINFFVEKNGHTQEDCDKEEDEDDENIQNTEPEFKNAQFDINPSQKQIQKFVFDDQFENKEGKTIDFNFLSGSKEEGMQQNINVDDFRVDDGDGNHKFMTEQSIQSFNKTILERLSTQEQSFSKWQKESKKNQGIKFSADFRDLYDSHAIGSDCVTMNSIQNNYDRIRFDVVDDNQWYKPNVKTDVNSDGLSLANKIIKFSCNLNQRSLTTIISTQFRLRGNSQYNIVLRSRNLENEESCLLRFIKEGYGYDMRLYILLGRFDCQQKEYLFIKKCEVALIKISDDNAISDYIDVNCKIVDIGNDQLKLKAFVNGNITHPFKIEYKQTLMPVFDNFNIYIVGTGEDLAISRAYIESMDRTKYLTHKDIYCSNSARCYCNLLQAIFFG